MESNLEEQLQAYGKKSSKKKYLVISLLLAILLAGAYYFLVFKVDESNNIITYKTKKLSLGDLEVTVMATGNLAPTNSIDIGIEVSGTIKEIFVDFNDEVKVNQVLAVLDTTKLKAKVNSSKASLLIAKANAKNTYVSVKSNKLVYDRTLEMYKKSKGKYPSKNTLDEAMFSYESAQSSYEAKKAQVLQAQFNLTTSEDDLGKAIVKSSINGIVLDRAIEVGQTVAASTSTPTLFTLAKDLRNMELIVNIDEADVADIKEKLNVTFTVDAYPDETFKGEIKQVRLNPIEESGVVTYETVVLVGNNNLLLRPGMTASAKIITKQLSNKLLLPNAALRFKPKVQVQNKRKGFDFTRKGPRQKREKTTKDLSPRKFKTIYILENEQVKRVRVRILETDGKFTGVESKELKEGNEVIISQSTNNE